MISPCKGMLPTLVAAALLFALPQLTSCRNPASKEASEQKTQNNESPLDRALRLAQERNASQPKVKELVDKIQKSEGFKKLDANEQIAVIRVAGGKNHISVDFRERINGSKYFESDATQQVETIRKFKTPSFPLLLMSDVLNAQYQVGPAVPAKTWPRATNFSQQDADRHEVSFKYPDGRSTKIDIFFHKAADRKGWISPDDMAKAMAHMPFDLLSKVPSVRISDFEGANASTGPRDGVIDYSSKKSPHPPRTMTHEAGHTFTYLVLYKQGVDANRMNDALKKDGGFLASAYAGTDIAERIGELGVVYTEAFNGAHKEEYRELFAEQIRAMEDAFEKAAKAKGQSYQRMIKDEAPAAPAAPPAVVKQEGPKDQKPQGASVGGYTCEQQKGWGKCGESWMKGVCDSVCKG